MWISPSDSTDAELSEHISGEHVAEANRQTGNLEEEYADAAPATQPDAKANANNLHNLHNPYNLGADASEGAVGMAARHDEAEEKAAGLAREEALPEGFSAAFCSPC